MTNDQYTLFGIAILCMFLLLVGGYILFRDDEIDKEIDKLTKKMDKDRKPKGPIISNK